MTSQFTSPQVERQTILHLLKNSEQLVDFAFSEQHFTDPNYQHLFLEIQEAYEQGRRANLTDCLTALKRKKITIPAKDLRGEPSGELEEAYKTLTNLYKCRETLKIAHNLITQTEERPEKINDVLATASEEIDIITTEGEKAKIQQFSEQIDEFIKECEEPKLREEGVKTGIKGIDDITGGFLPGSVSVVLARPGVGKSALLQNISLNMAMDGKSVALVTLEMTHKEVLDRIIAIYTQKPATAVRYRTVDIKKEDLEPLYDLNLAIVEDTMTYKTLEQKLSFIRRKTQAEVLLIDFIGMIGTRTGRDTSSYQGVGEVMEKIKNFAMKEEVAILIASQQNRESVSKSGKLNLSAIAESDKVSQLCSFALALREAEGEEGAESADLICTPLKNRHGGVRTFEVAFDRTTQKISDKEDFNPDF